VSRSADHDTVHGTIVFTDLVGFTAFNDDAGDDAAIGVLDRQTQIAEGALGALGDGRVVKELGDGLMLWFEQPASAVDFATVLLREIDAGRAEGSFPLAVRIGVHHGDAVARGDDLAGQTINVGARIADLAGPNEVLLSDAVVDACPEIAARATAIGGAQVKGVEAPIWLYRLAT
jgi:adenylate cyclase